MAVSSVHDNLGMWLVLPVRSLRVCLLALKGGQAVRHCTSGCRCAACYEAFPHWHQMNHGKSYKSLPSTLGSWQLAHQAVDKII